VNQVAGDCGDIYYITSLTGLLTKIIMILLPIYCHYGTIPGEAISITRRYSGTEEIYQRRLKNLFTPGFQAINIAERYYN
jgi:hypothetical protein